MANLCSKENSTKIFIIAKVSSPENIYIHTYIIGHYNPSIRFTVQLLKLLMLCALILYVNGRTYSLTSTPNDRFLRNFFIKTLRKVISNRSAFIFYGFIAPTSSRVSSFHFPLFRIQCVSRQFLFPERFTNQTDTAL